MRLDDVPREVLVAIAAAALLLVVLGLGGRRWRRHRMRHRFARAREGEREAVGLLEDHGFTVDAAQVAATYALNVDGASVPVALRVDYVVRRGNARFVAEVKTGKLAPHIDTSATRRQLLEYQHAFGADGVVLVDADARRVHVVTFETARRGAGLQLVAYAIAVIAAVVVLTAR